MTATRCSNPWPCTNPEPHPGGESGKGCVHIAAWFPDRHDVERTEQ